jgi:hypothetical protein
VPEGTPLPFHTYLRMAKSNVSDAAQVP